MKILIVSPDGSAVRKFRNLMICEFENGDVNLVDPEVKEDIDIRPYDLLIVDSQAGRTAVEILGRIHPAREMKPMLQLDFSWLDASRAPSLSTAVEFKSFDSTANLISGHVHINRPTLLK